MRARWLVLLGAGFGVLGLSVGALFLYAEAKLSRLVLGGLGEGFTTRIYAMPFSIRSGPGPRPDRIETRLARLGYVKTDKPSIPGHYARQNDRLTIYLRGFKNHLEQQESGIYELEFRRNQWELSSSSGSVRQIYLEPEIAAELSGPQRLRREPAASDEIPLTLKNAVVAAEDKRFYRHHGMDYRAMGRALLANLAGKSVLQGGSTITQQLSKNLFLTPRRTLKRKLAEALLAVYLETRYSKDEILTIYLNHIYLGQDGSTAVAGVKAAAAFYFSKRPQDLTLAECAFLAGLISSPHRYNPWRDAEEARRRRDFVLARMAAEGLATISAAGAARRQPLRISPRKPRAARQADYFVAEAVRQLVPRHGEDALHRYGLSVYTTMDPLLQADAQKAVAALPQPGALVALDYETGAVRALVGGKNFAESQFNRATQALRQPGSAFKPFVYAAALEEGFTPASQLEDKLRRWPKALKGSGYWEPRNYEGVYLGTATLRTALARSLNAATLDLANRVGPPKITELARRLGVASALAEDLGLALGVSEVTLLELTAAYAAFANGGRCVTPRLIRAVYDAEGTVLEYPEQKRPSALSPPTSRLMLSLLESVVLEGTARHLPRLGFARPAAGKTGTTNEGRDAWFVGVTPGLLAGVWTGGDEREVKGLTGGKDALPVWAAFMSRAAQDLPETSFPACEDLVAVEIDPLSGERSLSGCPARRRELFVSGTEPKRSCPLHPGGLSGWLKRLFGK